jgi:hypothetical protein
MGIINNLFDRFKNAELSIQPNKKIKTISKEFEESFGLTLVMYKGKMIAEPTLTLAALNKRTTLDVNAKSEPIKIKASMLVGAVEKMFEKEWGVKVQVKNSKGDRLVPNEITLGQASREEY